MRILKHTFFSILLKAGVFLPSIVLLSCVVAAAGPSEDLPAGYPKTTRQRLSLNTGWKFAFGDMPTVVVNENFDDSSWERVSIPHSLKLTSLNLDDNPDDKTQATFHREIGWYRRTFVVDAQPDNKVFIEFEGVHQVTDVWVNGKHAGQHAIGGYTPFHFDVSEFIHSDGTPNVLVVRADNTPNPNVPPDGGERDYILFGGVYRDVYLVVTDPVCVTFPWEHTDGGVRVTTPSVSEDNATISIRTNVRNNSERASHCELLTRVIDADHKVVLRLRSIAKLGPNEDHTFDQIGILAEGLRHWSCDSPYLYRVNTLVVRDGKEVDCVENPLGIRKFGLREGTGFVLNGKPLELVGVNRHQQFPYVGDAVPNSLHVRDAEQFKEAGFNIVRLAHYPHDDSFLDACDRLGILVCEEAPAWIEFGSDLFQRNLEEALRRTIRNHRNHPCVIGWGGGINHLGPLDYLHSAAKQEDPSRLTISNGTVWTGIQGSGVCDLWGVMDYRDVPETDEFLFSIEHKSTGDAVANQTLISRYKASWRRIGLAAWSSHDYNSFHIIDEATDIGKHNEEVPHLREFGIWDYFRQPRPVFYWYQSELTRPPMVHIADDRASTADVIKVFSNCDSVELLHNGVSVGRRMPDQHPELAHLAHPPISFPFQWKDGTITARGYMGEEEVATHSRSIPSEPFQIVLKLGLENRVLTADGADVFVAYAEIQDEQGIIISDCKKEISFRVEGNARIVGDESIKANPMRPIRGVAPVYVQAGEKPGRITLFASGAGLPEVSAVVTSVAQKENRTAADAKPIFDLDELRIDIGVEGQNVQESWFPWNGKDKNREELVATTILGKSFRASIAASSGDLTWKKNRGMPRPLCYLAEEAVASGPGTLLELTLSELSAGRYELTTYHHVLATQAKQPSPMTIFVTDAEGRDRIAEDSFLPTVWRSIFADPGRTQLDLLTRNQGPGEAVTQINVDGKSPIKISFGSNDKKANTWLNGFRLKQILEADRQ